MADKINIQYSKIPPVRQLLSLAKTAYYRLIVNLILVLLILTASGAHAQSYQYDFNNSDVNIPDAGNWVSSSITISGAPTDAVVTGIDVYFKCVHPYSGDLNLDLNADINGNLGNYDLWQREGGATDNPSKNVTGITTFNGLSVNRTWYLYARDEESGHSGYIDEWSIRIYYSTPAVTPSISSVSNDPVTGQDSSQPFTIYGSGFTPDSTVTLRDKRTGEVFADRPISSQSSTQITINPIFTTIAATWSVEVINNGVSSGEFTFEVAAPIATPSISSVSNDPVTGQDSSQPFTIYGSGFTPDSTVTLRDKRTGEVFADRPISSQSSTQITINPIFTTIAATWSVEVINNGVSSGEFTFEVAAPIATPSISSVSNDPVTGQDSSQPFTIYGSGFTPDSTVTLRDKRTGEVFADRPISSQSSTQITINPIFTTIAATWSVEVINNGVSSGEFTFEVAAPIATPSISSVSNDPVTGQDSSQPFTIYGSGFTPDSTVTLRDKRTGEVFADRPISSQSSTQITINPIFTTIAATWSVEVINNGVSSGEFTFEVVSPTSIEELIVNGYQLEDNEANWVHFVGQEIVPQLLGDRNERIRVAARATWWGLKEGIFSLSNPHIHSICSPENIRLEPLDVCESGMAWQVGLFGVQVPNFTEQEILAAVQALWPGREITDVLTEVAEVAGFDPMRDIGAAIVASDSILRKSWLLRHPAVGLILVEKNVTEECIDQEKPWCYGTGWPQTEKYASTREVALQSIMDLEAIFSSTPSVILEIPYIRQAGDTDVQNDSGGRYDGRWACGATSAVMIAAYHQRLSPNSIIVYGVNDACGTHTNDYGWYVSSKDTRYGYTYDEMTEDAHGSPVGSDGKPAYGAYGYIHDDEGFAHKEYARGFFRRHGLFSRVIDNPTEADIKSEIDKGHPVWASTSCLWKDNEGKYVGHIIVIKGYSNNGYYVADPWPFDFSASPHDSCADGSNKLYTWEQMGVESKWIVIADPIAVGDRVESIVNSAFSVMNGPGLNFDTVDAPRNAGGTGTIVTDSIYGPFYNSDTDSNGYYDHYTWWKIKWDDGIEGWSAVGDGGYGENWLEKIFGATTPPNATPPDTSITDGPSGAITCNDVIFTYTGSDDVTSTSNMVYSYKLDGYDSNWSSYTSSTSKSYNNLSNGSYTFYVKAKDEAGNVDPSAAYRSFTVDYVSSDLILSVTPDSRTVPANSGTTTFTVNNTGSGTMSWTASVISGESWLSITSDSASGTITAEFSANTSDSTRTGTIRVTASGAGGSPKDVIVIQSSPGTIDTDNDGLPDDWENQHFGNLTTADNTTDIDGDGLLDKDEYAYETDPNNTDSDDDGDSDGDEVLYGSDPTLITDTLDSHRPNTPVILQVSGDVPLRGQIFDVDGFGDPDQGDYLSASEWQISIDQNFNQNNIILQKVFERRPGAAVGAIEYRRLLMSQAVLVKANTYWVRTRHRDSVCLWSTWSNPVSFTTLTVDPDDTDCNGIDDGYQVAGFVDTNDNDIDDSQEDIHALYDAEESDIVGIHADNGVLGNLNAIPNNEIPAELMPADPMPNGLFSFRIDGLPMDANNPATVDITFYFPEPLSSNTKWYKYDLANNTMTDFTSNVTINGNHAVLSLTDGGPGDADGVVNGIIVDPSGPAVPPTSEPTPDPPSNSGGGGGGGCFIATAAFGSYMEPSVTILRQFRDVYLLPHRPSQLFVETYYRYSPSVADFIAEHNSLRAVVRLGLAPIIGMCWIVLNYGLLFASLIMMLFVTILFGSTVLILRRQKTET